MKWGLLIWLLLKVLQTSLKQAENLADVFNLEALVFFRAKLINKCNFLIALVTIGVLYRPKTIFFSTHTHARTHTRMHARKHACAHVHTDVHMHAHTHVHTPVHADTHTHTQ